MHTQNLPISKARLWGARVMSALPILFLLLDGAMKLIKPAPVVQAFEKLGYPISASVPLGIVLLVCTLLYAVPRSSVLGAILLTGYLGGAVSTHFRVGDPLFSHVLFPIYLGVFIWVGLCLRNAPLRALIPLRRDVPPAL